MPELSTDDILHKLAVRARDAYCRLRMNAQRIKSFNPGYEKYYKYWWRVATACAYHQIEPEEFMEAQFHAIKPWPEITVACSEKSMERFSSTRIRHAESVAMEAATQLRVFEQLSAAGVNSTEEILTNPNNEFDTLFVYVTARIAGLDKLAEECEEQALVQYMLSVYYDRIYKDAIPQAFRDRRRKVRQELEGGDGG
jgi:hypothetical protein